MKFNEVAERAERDEGFAKKLQEQAIAALKDGIGSPAWRELARNFADPDELDLLIPPLSISTSGEPNTTTLTTTITLSGGFTTTTTTTTTTSELCTLPGICPPDSAQALDKTPRKGTEKDVKAKKG